MCLCPFVSCIPSHSINIHLLTWQQEDVSLKPMDLRSGNIDVAFNLMLLVETGAGKIIQQFFSKNWPIVIAINLDDSDGNLGQAGIEVLLCTNRIYAT